MGIVVVDMGGRQSFCRAHPSGQVLPSHLNIMSMGFACRREKSRRETPWPLMTEPGFAN